VSVAAALRQHDRFGSQDFGTHAEDAEGVVEVLRQLRRVALGKALRLHVVRCLCGSTVLRRQLSERFETGLSR